MNRIWLNPDDVPPTWRTLHGYAGRKFQAEITDSVQPANMNWSGGTRYRYLAFHPASGEQREIIDRRPWPQSESACPIIPIEQGWIIVQHSTFCGKDHGLTFYVRPDMATALPAPVDDDPEDVAILCVATATLKNSYGGRKEIRFTEAARVTGITRERWDAAMADALALGYVRKNGSITPNGRNVAERNRNKYRIS